MKSIMVGHRKLTTIHWEDHGSWSLTTTWKVTEELNASSSLVIWHLKQIGKVKKLNKWLTCELTKKTKQNHCFKALSSLILWNNNEPFLNQIVKCNEKWIVYSNQPQPAQWLGWEEAPKHFLKPNLHPYLVDCFPLIHYYESQRNYYNWELCSASLWDALKTAMTAASFGQLKGTNPSSGQSQTTRHTINTSKVERIGLQSFASSAMFTWLSPTDYHFFKQLNNFLQGKCFHNQQEAENAF